jgi:hypothetical protein
MIAHARNPSRHGNRGEPAETSLWDFTTTGSGAAARGCGGVTREGKLEMLTPLESIPDDTIQ